MGEEKKAKIGEDIVCDLFNLCFIYFFRFGSVYFDVASKSFPQSNGEDSLILHVRRSGHEFKLIQTPTVNSSA